MSLTTRDKSRQTARRELPEITPVGYVDEQRSWCIYGRPGTGKTTLFGTFPKPSLLLDFKERGTDSVSDVKGLDVAKIRHLEDVDAVYWELKDGNLDYKSVCFDTISQCQELAAFEETGKKSHETSKWGGISRTQSQHISARLKQIITDFADLEDYEVVFNAHERIFNLSDEEQTEEVLTPEIGPRLMPSIRDVLNAQTSVIGQCYIRNKIKKWKDEDGKRHREEKIQYCLWVGPHPIKTAKIRKPRSRVPPTFLVNPTYEDLMEVIKGE